MSSSLRDMYIGVDVQSSRGCPYMVLNDNAVEIDCGWLDGTTTKHKANRLVDLVRTLQRKGRSVAVGIDAPRQLLQKPRQWYWRQRKWRRPNTNDKGNGRHCEVVIKAYGLANPQWTPLANVAPAWMKLGFALYKSLEGICDTYEVFPSASYTLLSSASDRHVTLAFTAFNPGPKDMLDACVAAFTVREFLAGRGCEVGGGNGLGTILLPTKLPENAPKGVLMWPKQHGRRN